MDTKKILNKVALAFAILAVIAFVVAISPGILTAILAIAALVLALFGLIVIVFGGFVALFTLASGTGVWDNVFSLCSRSWGLAAGIFGIVPPMADFCFSTHLSQIAAAIGAGFAVVAIVISIVSLTIKKQQDENADDDSDYVEEEENAGKKKAKKPKTDRTVAITCLVLGIVFTLLNVIAIFVANVLAQAYFAS